MLISTTSSNQCYIRKKEKRKKSPVISICLIGNLNGRTLWTLKQSLNASLLPSSKYQAIFAKDLEACAPQEAHSPP